MDEHAADPQVPGPDTSPAGGPAARGGSAAGARRSSARGALTLMAGTLGSRVTGLLRNSLLNQLFSPTITDAFTVALKVPNLFRELLAEGALTNSFVPVYKRLEPDEARRFSGALLALLVLVNALLVLAAELAAPWIVRLLLGSEGSVDAELAMRLTRAVFPFLSAISLSAWAMGVLNAEERFFAPAWAPVALNLVTVALMLLFPQQALPLALAFVLGGAVQFAFQLPFLARAGLWPRLAGLWHPQLAAVLLLMLPFAFTTSGRQFVNVVATRILNDLPEGAQTAFFNADLFFSLALGLFSISPALAYYSRLSEHAGRDDAAFRVTLQEGVRFITFLTVPAGLLLLLLAEPAVRVVFDYLSLVGRGLDAARLELSVAATAPLGLAVFPMGVFNLLIRTFYVRQRVIPPIAVTLVFLTLQAAGYALLAARYGIAGMAWATALVAWLQFAVMLGLVARREGVDLRAYGAYALRVWLAAGAAVGVAALALWALPEPLGWFGWLARAALGGGLGIAGYAVFGALLRLPELELLARRLRR